MSRLIEYSIEREEKKPIHVSLHLPVAGKERIPVLMFLHGFKGFKDWGHFPLMCEMISRSGFAVLRFNFSHNGTTAEHPQVFTDLDTFGKNTFSKELDDTLDVVEDIWWRIASNYHVNPERLGIIGHSRGGAIALLAALQEPRIKAACTWASVSDLEKRVNPSEEMLAKWYSEGVMYTHNARTGQDMPLYYSLREDFYAHKSKLDLPVLSARMNKPVMLIHGTEDTSVHISESEQLQNWIPYAELKRIIGADHTFGGKHPWTQQELPEHSLQVIKETVSFFRKSL